jgi:hypothetical protein
VGRLGWLQSAVQHVLLQLSLSHKMNADGMYADWRCRSNIGCVWTATALPPVSIVRTICILHYQREISVDLI